MDQRLLQQAVAHLIARHAIPHDGHRCIKCNGPSREPVCAECTAIAELDFLLGQRNEYLKGQVSLRRLPAIFARWTSPPNKLVAMNPGPWMAIHPGHDETFDPRSGNVIISGPEGIGKTSLARSMIRFAALHLGATISEYSGARMEEFSRGFDIADQINYLSHVQVLLLDDLGNAGWTKRGLNTLRQILDTRNDLHRCTIVTANQSEAELAAMFERVIDKNFSVTTLRRLCPLRRISMTGESYRKTLVYGEK